MIAGLQVARRLRLRTRPGYCWVPIGAGLGLFAMLGVAAGSDYWAHLFGLGFGVLFGVGWAIAQLKRGWRAPRPPVQALLGAARDRQSSSAAGCSRSATRLDAELGGRVAPAAKLRQRARGQSPLVASDCRPDRRRRPRSAAGSAVAVVVPPVKK